MELADLTELTKLQSCTLLCAWYALMNTAYKLQSWREQSQKEKEESDPSRTLSTCTVIGSDRSQYLLPKNRKMMIDQPLAAWCIENGVVWFSAWARLKFFGSAADARGSKLRNYTASLVGTIFSERLLLLLQWIVVHQLYAHIPKFLDRKNSKNSSTIDLVCEWLQNSVASEAVLATIVLLIKPYKDASLPAWSLRQELKTFSPLAFCAKLAVVRSLVDLYFWIGHYIIHQRYLYKFIHKLHHEHKDPHVFTNQHFTIIDLFVEAYMPLIFAVAALVANGVHVSQFEQGLLSGYITWLEACSHSGKPIPCSSLVAPLAPFYNYLHQWDRRNVEFHHTHHQILKCNYSITQWPDHLLGTTRWYRNKQDQEL